MSANLLETIVIFGMGLQNVIVEQPVVYNSVMLIQAWT